MTLPRLAAALAAMISALLLQATVIGPWAMPAAVTLPGLVVAIVAWRSGPATGMTFGFVSGILADLASNHALGALGLTWTLLGVVAGVVGGGPGQQGWRRTTVLTAALTTAATVVGGLLLTVFGLPGQATLALQWAPVTLFAQLLLAAALVPVVTAFLRAPALRPRQVTSSAAAALARRRAAGTGTASDDVALVQRG